MRPIILFDAAGCREIRLQQTRPGHPCLGQPAGRSIASARYWPNREKFISKPLLVATTTTRLGPERRLMKRTARRRTVDDNNRSLDRGQPIGELRIRHIGPSHD